VRTFNCAYGLWLKSRLPFQFPELPSNITHGLCFDPPPQSPLKLHAYYTGCVCAGLRDACTAHPEAFCAPNLHCLALIPTANFSSCMLVSVCSAGFITAEQALALFPAYAAIRSPRGILLLLRLYSLRL